MRNKFFGLVALLSVLTTSIGCTEVADKGTSSSVSESVLSTEATNEGNDKDEVTTTFSSVVEATSPVVTTPVVEPALFDFSGIPDYSGDTFYIVNDNVPFFTAAELSTSSFEFYSDLDDLGRCGMVQACVGVDIMPTEERGSIGMVKPTGWQSIKYDCVDGGYLYNRCHLLGYQLTGENANVKNLITGTRSLNIDGMLPFENLIADFVVETEMHVMYRVTPHFEGDNLLCSGVLLEAMSIEDNGEAVLFNVYAYNAQPNIKIDYATGDSWLIEEVTEAPITTVTQLPTEAFTEDIKTESVSTKSYILNTNTKKIHKPSCSSVDSMKESNKKSYEGSKADLEAQGYTGCGRCHPF